MSPDRTAGPLPPADNVALGAANRPRSRRPVRQIRRWYRRTSRHDVAVTMIVLGFAFLVLALTLIMLI